jgi:glutaredoxin-like protein NrdH
MIKVYTMPICVQCHATTRFLSNNKIPFKEIDLLVHEEAYEYVTMLGYKNAPVVIVNEDNHWSGFRPDKLGELLNGTE